MDLGLLEEFRFDWELAGKQAADGMMAGWRIDTTPSTSWSNAARA